MSIEYTYNLSDRTLTVRADEMVSIQDIQRYFEEVSRDPSVGETEVEVVELSARVDFNFRYGDTSELETTYRKMKVTRGIRHTIFIAADDLQYGMARMMAAIISNAGSAWAVRDRKELAELMQKEGI